MRYRSADPDVLVWETRPRRDEDPARHVAGGTPLQTANHGRVDLVVYASGYPPDDGAAILDSAI